MGARQLGAVLAVVLCLAMVVGATASSTTDRASAQAPRQDVTADTIVLDVRVHENGTATWEVAYRTRLDDAETTAAFESLQADVENNSTEYTDEFADRMTDTVASAERATGREMSAENFTMDAEIRQFPQRYGVITYSFRWHGFAAVSDGEMRIGDALRGLPLDEKTRLLVSWPAEYEATTIRPPPDEDRNGTAVWIGQMTFASDEPSIVLSPPSTGPRIPWATVAAALGALGVLGAALAGGLWLYRRDAEIDEPADDLPEDLLSNEERVIRLLERRGGRVKQKAIVEELGWTEAKTSQVVGSLREQGKIESFRLGRENVLALPQEEP